jgi:hypothetical protein
MDRNVQIVRELDSNLIVNVKIVEIVDIIEKKYNK